MTAPTTTSTGQRRSVWRPKLLAATVLAVCAALGLTPVAQAGGRAETKVTIKAEGLDLFGFVKSEKPGKCADGRKVIVYKQEGNEQDKQNDEKFASDNASLNGDRYMWSTGNTGQSGKFYARVRKTDDCKGDYSRTIEAQQ